MDAFSEWHITRTSIILNFNMTIALNFDFLLKQSPHNLAYFKRDVCCVTTSLENICSKQEGNIFIYYKKLLQPTCCDIVDK